MEKDLVKTVVTLSYHLPRAVEEKLIRDAETRSVRWRQRHGEGLFSPDANSESCGNARMRA